MEIEEQELEKLLHHLSEVDSLLRFIIRRGRIKEINELNEQEKISEAYNKVKED